MFQRNICPPSSGSKSNPSKKAVEAGSKLSHLLLLKMVVAMI
jgi:hypothetical protein